MKHSPRKVDLASLREQYGRGDKVAVIAARQGVSVETVRKWCRKLGVPGRRPWGRELDDESKTTLARLFSQGNSVWRISIETRLAYRTVRKWLHLMGLRPRTERAKATA